MLFGAALGLVGCADAVGLTLPAGGTGGSLTTSGGSGGGGTGGSGGVGGEQPVECVSNSDCADPKSLCDLVYHVCVQCRVLADCASKPGTVCDQGVCECPGGGEYCGPNECVDLTTASEHCGSCGHGCFGACAEGKCVDPWEPLPSAGAPTARGRHVAVWTGDRMIVWGGSSDTGTSNNLDTGGVYDPAAYAWTPTSQVNAPTPRQGATAVWTGDRMIVWGGRSGSTYRGDGASYDPVTKTWSTVATSGAPTIRAKHTAVWASDIGKMIVWGGFDGTNQLSDGGSYDPTTNTWTPVPSPGAPRQDHTAAWDSQGKRMIIYGGFGDGLSKNDVYLPSNGVPGGHAYDPSNNSWSNLSQIGEPSARALHSMVLSGAVVLVFGGYNGQTDLANGYRLAGASWTSFGGLTQPARREHRAVYLKDAARMVVWGGRDSIGVLGSGAVYDPGTNKWEKTTPDMITARVDHSAVSTGATMIVWGGFASNGSPLQAGATYKP
jgi:N-acetylneuraminic acid mutarotase